MVAVLLVVPVPPSVEVMAPVVLSASPAAVPVTLTLSVQDKFLVTLAPERLITPVPAVAVTVPPQVFVTPGTAATTKVPVVEGSVSLNATPLKSTVAFGLVIVNVRLVVPFSGMLAAPKAFAIVGGATTVMLANAVLPVPALVEVTWTLLFFTPAVVPCTFTETVQLAFLISVAPLKDTMKIRRLPGRAAARAIQITGRGQYQSCRQVVSKSNAIQCQVQLVLQSVNVRWLCRSAEWWPRQTLLRWLAD